MSRLLSPEEFRHRLGVSRPTAYRILASGVIPVVRVGKLLRIRESALEEYIAANERRATNVDEMAQARA